MHKQPATTRKAKRWLMDRLPISEPAAYAILRCLAMQERVKVEEVAARLLDGRLVVRGVSDA